MADFRKRIEVLIDFTTDRATRGMQSLRREVAQADGVFGKAKAGAKGLGDQLGIGVQEAALAAGAALVSFGVKSVMAFQDTAIAAGRFADATGLAVDEASRWIEVGSDVSISADTIQSAFGRFAKQIKDGTSPALEQLGVDAVLAADGTTDLNATIIAAIDALQGVKDPAERARIASQLFGRGWQGMAELVTQDAESLSRALAGVSDAQVIDEDEERKAKAFREAMDGLRDSFTEVQMAVGEALVPALTDMADALLVIKDAGEALPDLPDWLVEVWEWVTVWRQVPKAIGLAGDALDYLDRVFGGTIESTEIAAGAFDMQAIAAAKASTATDDLSDSTLTAADSADVAADAEDRLREAIEARYDAALAAIDAEYAHRDAVADLQATMADGEATWQDRFDAAREVAEATLTLAENMAEANGETLTGQERTAILVGALEDVLETVKVGSPLYNALTEYIAKLAAIPSQVSTTVRVTQLGPNGPTVDEYGNVRAGATGGIVTRPTMALIGESGPEMVLPLNGAPGARSLAGAGGGGGGGVTLVVNNNGGGFVDPDALAREMQWRLEGMR